MGTRLQQVEKKMKHEKMKKTVEERQNDNKQRIHGQRRKFFLILFILALKQELSDITGRRNK